MSTAASLTAGTHDTERASMDSFMLLSPNHDYLLLVSPRTSDFGHEAMEQERGERAINSGDDHWFDNLVQMRKRCRAECSCEPCNQDSHYHE